MIISGVVKGRLDKRFTLVRKERARIGDLSKGDILVIEFGGNTIISKVLEDYIISLPRRLLAKTGSRIRIKILKHMKPQRGLERPNKPFYGNEADLKYFTPKKTVYGKDMFVINDKKRMFVWFPHGGGIKLTHINRFVEKEKLFEAAGLLLGDGSTEGVRSIRFTNCQTQPINHFIDIFEAVGVDKNIWKAQIILSRPKKPDHNTMEKCKAFWAKNLKLPKENIKSLSWSRSKGNGSKYGSARIFVDDAALFEIFVNGTINYCTNNIDKVDEEILGISTIPPSKNRNEFEIRGWENLLKLFLIDGFKLSDKNGTFTRGFIYHRSTAFRYNTLRRLGGENKIPGKTIERLIANKLVTSGNKIRLSNLGKHFVSKLSSI